MEADSESNSLNSAGDSDVVLDEKSEDTQRDNSEITAGDPEVELSNKLADYAKSNWINTTADIYGESNSQTNVDTAEIIESTFATEEEMLTSRMSELINGTKEEDIVDQNIENVELLSDTQESPLPTEGEIEDMLAEIRQIEQEEIRLPVENTETKPDEQDDELKSVLSSIPSFSEMNQK